MESTIAIVALAIASGLAGLAAWIFGGSWLLRRRLRRLRATRSAAEAEALCRAAFPDQDGANVRAACRWVQALVAIEDMPLHPDDRLQATLGIRAGAIAERFEASYECYGAEIGTMVADGDPDTVQGLMASVLAAGYEFFPSPDRRRAATA